MDSTTLGSSGVRVSAVCLGTMTFGNQTGAADAHAQMDRALAAGITFIDTAELYPVNPVRRETVGRTEEIVGDWLSARGTRDRVQIATKAAGPGDKVRAEGFDGAILRRTIDASLRRLKTDYIDLYQLHWPVRGSYAFRQNWRYDPSKQDRAATLAHMQDVLGALDEAVRAGKVRAIGLSNESAWGTARWIDTAERMGAPRMASIQNEYSLLYRAFDTDLAELAVNEGVTLLAYSPLAAGLLTGKYRGGDPGEGRFGKIARLADRYLTPENLARVDRIADWCDRNGLVLTEVAFAWLLSKPVVASVMAGATKPEQVTANAKAAELRLNETQIGELEALLQDE